MEMDIKWSGFKEIDAILKELPDEMAKKVVEQATRSGAKVVLDAARENVPVDKGQLKASLVIKKDAKAFKKFGTVKYLVGANLQARRGKTAPHAHLVEFGTVKMAAHPFLRPALENNVEAILTVWRGKLWQGIQVQAAALAGKYGSNRRK